MNEKSGFALLNLNDLYQIDLNKLIYLHYLRDYSPSWAMRDLHAHPSIEVGYVVEGILYLCIESNVIKMNQNDFFIIPPGVAHSIYVDAASGSRIANIQFNLTPIIKNEAMFEYLSLEKSLKPFFGSDDCRIGEMVMRINDELNNRRALYEDIVRIEVFDLLVRIRSQMLMRKNSNKYNNKHIHDAVGIIDSMLSEQITPQLIADRLDISKDHLMHLFSKTMGISIMQYVTERRVKEAQRLLISTDLPISQIAQESGFLSIQHFSNTVKKHVGITPSEYRSIGKYMNESLPTKQ